MHTSSLAGPCTLVCSAGAPCLHISVRHVLQKCAACDTFGLGSLLALPLLLLAFPWFCTCVVRLLVRQDYSCRSCSKAGRHAIRPRPHRLRHSSHSCLCDADSPAPTLFWPLKIWIDYTAGEAVVAELAPELVPMLSALEMPANFVPVTNAVLSEMQRRGVARDQLLTALRRMGEDMPCATVAMLQVSPAQNPTSFIRVAHLIFGLLVAFRDSFASREACWQATSLRCTAMVRAEQLWSTFVPTALVGARLGRLCCAAVHLAGAAKCRNQI